MPTVPIRGLAEKGILRDPSPYQLDLNAWSGGANVRFHANKAERAPIWRTVYSGIPEEPVYCVGLEPSTGYDTVMTVGADGRSWQYGSGTITEVTPSGFSPASDPRHFTSTFLGDVLYLNRPNQAPQYFGPLSTTFANIPNQECAWTCRSLRAFGDYLIALNVTKPATFTDPHTGILLNGGPMPNLFKWSDLTLAGQTPGSWDPDDPTTSAGENPLEELNTPIVDGLPLRNIFVIYSETQIWAAEQIDSVEIFEFNKLFDEGGMIAPNCAVEVDGVHYVFGPKDIYKHDGVSKVSIIDKRNKNYVFRNLNKAKSEVCFVAYMPQYDSIVFGFNTGVVDAQFNGNLCDRCNFGAVYDLSADTWSFIDLPNVSALTQSNLDTVLTYATCPSTLTYANVGGSYYDQDNTFVKNVVACSGTVSGLFTANRLLGYDFFDKGNMAFPYEPECNAPAFLERTGLALDQIGSDLTTYKKVRRIFPLISVYANQSAIILDAGVPTVVSTNTPVLIEVGGAETPAGTPTYNTAVSFDPAIQYKIDGIKGGRYLALRFTVSGPADFEVAGFDLDVTNGGRR
jgi:hypothetical protein